MHIILSDETAKTLAKKYTCLPLDVFKLSADTQPVQAYCVLEDIPITELPKLDEYKTLHENLVVNYKKQNWNFCEQAIEHLNGKWGGQIDSFYAEISQRIAKYKEQDPGKDWDYTIQKY